ISRRRLAEEPLVLSTKLRGIFVAHPIAGARGIQVFAQHETPRLLEPELLLELQGAHRGHRLELVMKPRDAHSHRPCQALNPERLVKLLAQALDGGRDALALPA